MGTKSDLYFCYFPRAFIKSFIPCSVGPSDVVPSFKLPPIQQSPGLPIVSFSLNQLVHCLGFSLSTAILYCIALFGNTYAKHIEWLYTICVLFTHDLMDTTELLCDAGRQS